MNKDQRREQEFSAFTQKAFDAIEHCIKEKHPRKPICHRDLTGLDKAQRSKVHRVVHERIMALRRAVWLGEDGED